MARPRRVEGAAPYGRKARGARHFDEVIAQRMRGAVSPDGIPWQMVELSVAQAKARGLVTTVEFAEAAGYHPATVVNWRSRAHRNGMPDPVGRLWTHKRGPRPLLYDPAELLDWWVFAIKRRFIYHPHNPK